MKLLTITHDSSKTGAAVSLLNLISGLRNKGVEFHVVVPELGYLTNELEKLDVGFSILKISFNVWPSFGGFRNVHRYIKSCIRMLLRFRNQKNRLNTIILDFKPDIIHTNVSVISIGYKLAVKHGIPHIWHIREYGDLHYNFRFFPTKRMYFKDIRESWSIAITNDIKKHYKCNERCQVIYDGISDIKVHNIGIIEKKFIYVSILTPAKGATDLVNAFIEFCKKNNEFALHFYGRCDSKVYEEELKRLLLNTAAERRVFFHGEVSNVDDVMRSAWAIIVPTKNEGFGRITAEAMFNSCLVIGRNDSGTKEQFDNGFKMIGEEIGYRFNSVEDLTEKMVTVSKMNINDRSIVTSRAKDVCEKLYSNDVNVDRTYEFICKIIN